MNTYTNKPNDLKNAIDAGYVAFFNFDETLDHRGKMKGNSNPHYVGSLLWKNWEHGFNRAYFDNLKGIKHAS